MACSAARAFSAFAIAAACVDLVTAIRFTVADDESVAPHEIIRFDSSVPLPKLYLDLLEPRHCNDSEFELKPEFESYLQTLAPIPQKAHVSFPYHNVTDSRNGLIVNGLGQLIDLNPGWVVKVWNDTEVEAYIEEKLSPKDYELIRNRHIVEKVDLWRTLVMYFEGGFYMDIDKFVNIPLAEVIHNETRLVWPGRFAHSMMGSSKGNALFAAAIQRSIEYRATQAKKLTDLGPGVYIQTCVDMAFGYDHWPGKVYATMFEALRGSRSIASSRRQNIIFDQCRLGWHAKHSDGGNKGALYNEYGMKHWSQDENNLKKRRAGEGEGEGMLFGVCVNGKLISLAHD